MWNTKHRVIIITETNRLEILQKLTQSRFEISGVIATFALKSLAGIV